MKDLSLADILQPIWEWCGRPLGAFTILAILAVIGLVIVMAVKENCGKDSFEHRIACIIVVALYAIIALNLTSSIIAWLLGIKWLATTILAIIYIAGTWYGTKRENIVVTLSTAAIAIGGIHGIYQGGGVTLGIGALIAIISIFVYCCENID